MVQEIDHNEFGKIIKRCYKKKIPVFCYGLFGVGKSTVVLETAKELAEEREKQFVEWNEVSKEKKDEIIKNPEPYFVLVDVRLAQLEPSDLKGIPDLEKNGAVEWKPPLWVFYASRDGADGILFFDEANLSPPSVQSAFYQIVHDRESGSFSISDQIGMVSAGNRLEDKSNVFEMSEALKDRYLECELQTPSVEDWTDWALDNDIDSRIISYLQYKRPHLNKPQFDNKNKSTTPRGWERLSELVEDVDDDYDKLRTLAGVSIGEGVATEFASFLKLQEKIDIRDFIENPSDKELPTEIDMKYSLVSGIVNWYVDNRSEKTLSKVVTLADRFEPEIQVLLLRLAKDKGGEQYFRNHIREIDGWKDVADRFSRYVL